MRAASALASAALRAASAFPSAAALASAVALLLGALAPARAGADELDPLDTDRAAWSADRDAVARALPLTALDLVDGAPGAFVARTNAGGGLWLRGLGGPRVLVLLDGVRLGGAIVREGLEGPLSTVDPYAMERVAIAGGPSIRDGAGAYGVVRLDTKQPVAGPWAGQRVRVDQALRGATADESFAGRVGLDGRFGAAGLRGAGGLRFVGPLHTPRGEVPFYGWRERTYDLAARGDLGDNREVRLVLDGVVQEDAPRPDRSAPDEFALVRDRARHTGYGRYAGRHGPLELELTLSMQSQDETREVVRLARDAIARQGETDATLGATARGGAPVGPTRLAAGVEFYRDVVSSRAETETISTGAVGPGGLARYPDGARRHTLEAFAWDEIDATRWLRLGAGGRFAWAVAEAPRNGPLGGFERSDEGGAGEARARVGLGDFVLFAAASQGFRAPNLDEISGLGCGDRGWDTPNAGLLPEKPFGTEAGLVADVAGVVRASMTYSFAWIRDVVVRVPQPGLGVVEGCGGGAEVVAWVPQNAGAARVHALEVDARLEESARWAIFWRGTFVHGERDAIEALGELGDAPFQRVPPLEAEVGVEVHDAAREWFVRAGLHGAATHDRLAPEDRIDARVCPGGGETCAGTPGWLAAFAGAGLGVRDFAWIVFEAKNLTNAAYRAHGAAVDAPGASAMLGLSLDWGYP